MGLNNRPENMARITTPEQAQAFIDAQVKEEDIPKYGKTVGLGTLIIGLFMVAAFVVSLYTDGDLTGYVMIPGFVIGLGFILYGQFKYNKGII